MTVTDVEQLEHRIAHELEQIDNRLESLERVALLSDAKLAELVRYEERRDRREEEALRIERERREESADAQARRVDAEIVERSARGAWLRSMVTPTTVLPIMTALGGILGTLGLSTAVTQCTGPLPVVPTIAAPAPEGE